MIIRIALEWEFDSEISLSKMYPLREGIEDFFVGKSYGDSIKTIRIVLVCRSIDIKQVRRFKKNLGVLEFDIVLDFFKIKNADLEQKKIIIVEQIVQITEITFKKYKFANFDTLSFLADLNTFIFSLKW